MSSPSTRRSDQPPKRPGEPRPITAREAAPASLEVTPAEAAAMLRAAFALFAKWGVTDAQARRLLGQPSASTLYRWKRGEIGAIPPDTVWRLGDLMGIHKALRYMFTDPARGYAWVRKPSLDFGGRSALERMLAGAPGDLAAVRAYLDAERGGW
jgi:Protein of unknown function (DUF2384)